PNSATAQTELSTLSQAASALAAAKSASSLTTANGNYASAETTAAGTYHKLEAGAANTYQTTTAPAEANDASQTASAIGPYDLAASQAASGLTTSLASFAGDSTSYSIADLAQWPDAPPVPSADDSYQPTPPVSAPTYSGPVFDVQEDHGYQINVGLAEGDYNTAI